MGMLVQIYRQVNRQHADGSAHMVDCTAGGWSSKFNTVCVTNIPGPFEASLDVPAVKLIDGPGPAPNPILVSEEDLKLRRWTMFGGNFAFTSDSRFSKAVRDMYGTDIAVGAIKCHDRVEG
jgi:hypothetical protein